MFIIYILFINFWWIRKFIYFFSSRQPYLWWSSSNIALQSFSGQTLEYLPISDCAFLDSFLFLICHTATSLIILFIRPIISTIVTVWSYNCFIDEELGLSRNVPESWLYLNHKFFLMSKRLPNVDVITCPWIVFLYFLDSFVWWMDNL